MALEPERMSRYCLVCDKVYGPQWQKCCIEGSLIAFTERGFIKKTRLFFTLIGQPLSAQQMDDLKKRLGDLIEQKKACPQVRPAEGGPECWRGNPKFAPESYC
jgi:hypothetical protein